MCRTYFTSDLHIGHKKVAEIRGFRTPTDDPEVFIPDTDAHDAALARNWDTKVVCSRCVVHVLGDLSVGYGPPERKALEWVRARKGIKRKVLGNHDGAHPLHSGSHRMEGLYREVFETVRVTDQVRIEKQKVFLSHFPYLGSTDVDHTELIRYAEWRLTDHGFWLLHGHTHKADQILHDGHQIHVGLDAHGLNLVDLGYVAKIIRGAA